MVLCSCKSLDGWIEPSYDPWLDSINEQTIIPTFPNQARPCINVLTSPATRLQQPVKATTQFFFYRPNTILNLELSMYSVYSEYSLLEL